MKQLLAINNKVPLEKIKQIDLGTLTWTRNVNYTYPFFIASLSAKSNKNLISYKYTTINPTGGYGFGTNTNDLIICINTSGTEIYIRDNAYINIDDFKKSLQGMIIVYEKA